MIRAAASFVHQGLGTALLVGREDARARDGARRSASSSAAASRSSMRACRTRNAAYADYLYERLQRQGFLLPRLPAPGQSGPQPFRRLHGGARRRRRDGHRRHPQFLGRARRRAPRASIPSPAIASSASRSCWRAAAPCWSPTPRSPRCRTPTRSPTSPIEAARRRARARLRAAGRAARLLDLRPSAGRALRARAGGGAASSTSGASISNTTARWRPTSRSTRSCATAYPFCRLSGPANVLVMPAFHSASISTKMLQELGGATVIGPLLVGLDKPVQIVPLGAKDADIVNMAALAAYNVGG